MAGIVIPIDTKRGRNELDLLQREFKETGQSAKKTEKAVQDVEKRINKGLGAQKGRKALTSFNKGLKNTSKAMLGLQGMMAGFTLAAGIATVGVIGAKFEKEMATVGAVTRATAAEFEMLEDQARKMGATTEWTASQAAGALRFLGMAGFEATKASAALPGVLDLATASGVDLARSADIASNALTAMQLEVSELGRVNDVFVATMTRSNVDMEMLAESFKYSAPLANALGYEIEELSAMIGVLGNAGIQGSMAGTQLAFAFNQLPKVWKELGINGEGKNLIDALELMNKAGWESEKVMKVFGQRGGRAVLVMRDLVPQYRRLADANREAQGESKKLADVIRDTVVGDFNTLKSTLESLAIDTFKQYKGEIRAALQGTTQYFRENKTEIMATIKGLGELIVALTKAIGKMAEWTGAFTKGLGEAAKTAGEIAGEKDLNWTDFLMPGKAGLKLGRQSKTGPNVQDLFTGKGTSRRAAEEAKRESDLAAANKKMEANRSRMGGVGYDLESFFEEIDKAEQLLIDKMKAEAAGAKVDKIMGGDMSAADRSKREAILNQWRETKETYRLDDEQLELRALEKEYQLYSEHLQNKTELDRWYEDEKTRIKTDAAMIRAEEEKRRQEELTEAVNIDLEDFFADVDEADAKLQETKTNFQDFSTIANESLATGLSQSLWDMTEGIDAAKLSFGNFATSFVKDITIMIAKQMILNSLTSMTGGGGGQSVGLLSGLFSRAGGGRVSPGKGYWVGERGPERFTPETKGRIEPAGEQKAPEVKIANIMDPAMINEYMNSSAGQGAILNVISDNPDEVKQAIS